MQDENSAVITFVCSMEFGVTILLASRCVCFGAIEESKLFWFLATEASSSDDDAVRHRERRRKEMSAAHHWSYVSLLTSSCHHQQNTGICRWCCCCRWINLSRCILPPVCLSGNAAVFLRFSITLFSSTLFNNFHIARRKNVRKKISNARFKTF